MQFFKILSPREIFLGWLVAVFITYAFLGFELTIFSVTLEVLITYAAIAIIFALFAIFYRKASTSPSLSFLSLWMTFWIWKYITDFITTSFDNKNIVLSNFLSVLSIFLSFYVTLSVKTVLISLSNLALRLYPKIGNFYRAFAFYEGLQLAVVVALSFAIAWVLTKNLDWIFVILIATLIEIVSRTGVVLRQLFSQPRSFLTLTVASELGLSLGLVIGWTT